MLHLGSPVCSEPCRTILGKTVKLSATFEFLINLSGLSFPVPVNQVARFERNYPRVSINVFSLSDDDQQLIPNFVSKFGRREKHVNLLLLTSKTDGTCGLKT